MADHFETVKELAATALIEGEQVRTAALVNYGGKVNVNQPPPGLSALGHHDTQLAAGEALVDRYGEYPEVSFPSAKQMALVLTDIRLLVWSRGLSMPSPRWRATRRRATSASPSTCDRAGRCTST